MGISSAVELFVWNRGFPFSSAARSNSCNPYVVRNPCRPTTNMLETVVYGRVRKLRLWKSAANMVCVSPRMFQDVSICRPKDLVFLEAPATVKRDQIVGKCGDLTKRRWRDAIDCKSMNNDERSLKRFRPDSSGRRNTLHVEFGFAAARRIFCVSCNK